VLKQVVVSAIQPTGRLHVGNYVGAIAEWVRMQDEYDCFFPLVDLHALTVRHDPADLRQRCYDFVALYVACGIDPAKSVVFAQSHVPAHSELQWVLTCFATLGELSRMTQFKAKSDGKGGSVNAGLYLYPVLMASDILLYKTDRVPVGADQKQHLELARDLAIRFNATYGDVFHVPEPMIPKLGARIMSLQDPESKMSKSDKLDKNVLALLDDPEAVRSKLARAVTDSLSHVAYNPARPGISNLVSLYSALAGMEHDAVEKHYAGVGYGRFKSDLADIVNETLAPVRERYAAIRSDEAGLDRILAEGAAKAGRRANATLEEVYDRLGLIPAAQRTQVWA